MIDDLLDVTRIARGKLELSRSTVELCTASNRAVEVCQPDIEARGLDFGADLGPAAPYWIEADVARLQQVFWNLLKNAIKFTPHGGCVGLRCRPEPGHVVVEVNDSGIGIEPVALPEPTEDVEHHVHVGERQTAAGFKHPRLLRQDVKVEADAVPGEKRVTAFDLGCQIMHQRRSFSLAHPVRRTSTVTAMPQDRLLVVAGERRRAGDAQGTAGSPIPFRELGGFQVKSEVAASHGIS